MTEGKKRDEWSRTSAFMALTANCHRDPKRSKGYEQEDFNPFGSEDRRRRKRKQPKVGIGILKDVFIDRKWPDAALHKRD